MARAARGEWIRPEEIQIVHAVQRCVRGAFLCGWDERSGKSFEHRRRWIRDRMRFLASVFGIDCLTFAVMHNHLHLVLRSRPDVVASWSDEEVARRWLRLFPKRKRAGSPSPDSKEADIAMMVSDPSVIASRRKRLSDISWWMRCLAEVIAREANREDRCKGRFWEGRYKAQLLLDEASVLACAAYVDLNPIRAAIADTPENSSYTGAKERLDDLMAVKQELIGTPSWERSDGLRNSAWLCPVEICDQHDGNGVEACFGGKRASDKGFLTCSLLEYVRLLDWTGRQIRGDKRGAISKQLSPILERIGIEGAAWCSLVSKFGRIFKRAAGSAPRLRSEAMRRRQRWLQAPGNPLQAA